MRPTRPQRKPRTGIIGSVSIAKVKFYKMKLPKRTWQEVTLYASGMLSIILGVGSAIVSIDPTPFPTSSWWYFLVAGVLLSAFGCVLLRAVICAPVYHPMSFFPSVDDATASSSVVDLLDDAQSIGNSSLAELKDDHFFGIEESPSSTQVVRQCMMTVSDEPHNAVFFYYKETFV